MNNAALRKIANGFRKGTVTKAHGSWGMCFAVCAPLAGYLQFLGVQCQLREVHFRLSVPGIDLCRTNHYWIDLPDGRILDPTADQFSGPYTRLPPVYIGPIPPIYEHWIAELNKGDAQ